MSTLLENFHASLGDAFTGLPIQPKSLALQRPSQLQNQLDALDAEDPANADFIAHLTREIDDANAVIAAENYTEVEDQMAYYGFYNLKLKEFIEEMA
jgi:hypothetical protein